MKSLKYAVCLAGVIVLVLNYKSPSIEDGVPLAVVGQPGSKLVLPGKDVHDEGLEIASRRPPKANGSVTRK